MRALSLRSANTCETATCKRCKCRCGGKLHGAARGNDDAFFMCLPEDDPHFATTPEVRRQEKAKRKRIAKDKAWRDKQAVGDLFDARGE
jgi:hypothetical protein